MSQTKGHEIELKLELRPEDAARIGKLKSLPQARIGLPKAEQVVSVYFDTPGLALRRSGLSLRLRHAGSKRLQTVKTEPLAPGLAAPRLEDEVPVNGAGPDLWRIKNPELRDRLLNAATGETLAPRFETVILRTTRHIKTQAGDLVELVVDLGEVRANEAEHPICEVELELKSGAPAALFDLAQALNETAPLRLVRLTKADRGYGLLGEVVGAPQKAKPLVLPPDVTARGALGLIVENGLNHLLANEPAVVEQRDVEGLHQFRVALRRLRAALSTYAPLLAGPHVTRLEEELKAVAKICGAARDYDVFLDSTLPAAETMLADLAAGRAALVRAATRARADAWAKTVEAVASARFTRLILDLARLGAGAPLDEASRAKARHLDGPARRFAARALDVHRKRAGKLADKIDQLDDEDRHKLRKRLKRLRYTAEFFASLFAEADAKSYLKRLSALQDCFGTLNDVATAERIVEGVSAFATSPGTDAAIIQEAGTRLIVYHRVLAEATMAEAGERWKKLAKQASFWRET